MTFDTTSTGDDWDSYVPQPTQAQQQLAEADQAAHEQYAPKKSSGGGGMIGGILSRFAGLAVVGVIGAVGWIANQGTTVATDLVEGDCFNVPSAETEEFDRLDTEPCDGPHDGQIILVLTVPSASTEYPSFADNYWEVIWERCLGASDNLLRQDALPEDTLLDFFSPTEEAWNMGDRESMCFIESPSGLNGSHVLASS